MGTFIQALGPGNITIANTNICAGDPLDARHIFSQLMDDGDEVEPNFYVSYVERAKVQEIIEALTPQRDVLSSWFHFLELVVQHECVKIVAS